MSKIEEEYKKYKLSIEISEHEIDDIDLLLNIEDILERLHEEEIAIKKEQIKESILRRIIAPFSESSAERMMQDEEYLEELMEHVTDNEALFGKIAESITKEKVPEFIKLIDFLIKHYINNYQFIQEERKQVEYSMKGINYSSGKENTREEIKQFVNNILEKENRVKTLEKKNEI